MNFADKLLAAIDEKQNPCCVGLDPHFDQLPEHVVDMAFKQYGHGFEGITHAILDFNIAIIDAVHTIVPAVKPQISLFEKFGPPGVATYQRVVNYAKEKGLIVIGDAKRNDIGSSATAYAEAHLGRVEVRGVKHSIYNTDALTVNGYFGTDGIQPFLDQCKEYDKGLFVLVKTSNPSSKEVQNPEISEGKHVYDIMANLTNEWGKEFIGERGFSSIGGVVGATHPKEAELLREMYPNMFFLVPGYDTQGAKAKDVVANYNKEGYGAVVNSARGVIFAFERNPKIKEMFKPEQYALAAREAALYMKEDICSALKEAGKYPSGWD